MSNKMSNILLFAIFGVLLMSGCTPGQTTDRNIVMGQSAPVIQANKDYILKIVNFDVKVNMYCYGEDHEYINSSGGNIYDFSVWKSGRTNTEIREHEFYVEEIKYPDFEIDITFPKEYIRSCEIPYIKIYKTITGDNQTWENKCVVTGRELGLNPVTPRTFDYTRVQDAITHCLINDN